MQLTGEWRGKILYRDTWIIYMSFMKFNFISEDWIWHGINKALSHLVKLFLMKLDMCFKNLFQHFIGVDASIQDIICYISNKF